MKKDYSEYSHTEYEKYRIRRSNRRDVRLDYFLNYISFKPEEKQFVITVDDYNEYESMRDLFSDFEKERAEREGGAYVPHHFEFDPQNENEEDVETMQEVRKENEERFSRLRKKYVFLDLKDTEVIDGIEVPIDYGQKINLYSGLRIKMNYGEGILDFLYADFRKPLQEAFDTVHIGEMLAEYGKTLGLNKEPDVISDEPPEKVYSETQAMVEDFLAYERTFSALKDVAYASLYTAICPPLFTDERVREKEKLQWYGNYILELQREFLEMIEFCFDEEFYPEVLGGLYPSERLYLYRQSKNLPEFFHRDETLRLSKRYMSGRKMPYGLDHDGLIQMFQSMRSVPTEAEKEFAEKYHLSGSPMVMQHRTFMSLAYEARTVQDMLELEFTKMLEQDIRFRKCKRCGRYFIMKGKYDTNYCERIAEGETRTCQQLASAEKYKASIADKMAIPIYNKYYKRYAARVKVRQIKEEDFRKWKYKAIQKRDQCSDGLISVEELTEWMEASFPNRKPKS